MPKLMRFIIFCIKIALVTYWGPHGIIFAPPPKKKFFRKEMNNIYVHFRKVFVEFVVFLTKIWPTNIDFLALQLSVGEGVVQRAVFTPPSFTPRSD